MSVRNSVVFLDLYGGGAGDAERTYLTGCDITFYGEDEGDEILPELTSNNWSLNSAWQYLTSPNRLEKYQDGTTEITVNPTKNLDLDRGYVLRIVIDSISGGTLTILPTNTEEPLPISASGTYTLYVSSITEFKIGVSDTGVRCVISSISLKMYDYYYNSSYGVKVTKTAHGLLDGAVIYISDPLYIYRNNYTVSKIDNDTFLLNEESAYGILKVESTPIEDTTFTIDTQVFTFKESRSGTGEVTISSDKIKQAKNIQQAIQADLTNVYAFIGVGGLLVQNGGHVDYQEDLYKVVVQSIIPGLSGNSIVFTEDSSNCISINTNSGYLENGENTYYGALDVTNVTIMPKGGQSWSDAFLTIPNGISWPRFNFPCRVLISKCPTGVSIGSATWNNASKIVTLDTAQNTTIDLCETAWTGANSASVVRQGVATDAKEGSYCMQITAPSTPSTQKLYAYYATGELDLSSYQRISFWIKNQFALTESNVNAGSFVTNTIYRIITVGSTDFTLIGASANTVGVEFQATGAGSGTGVAATGQWFIALCSDTAGATPVDKFPIPIIPSTDTWLPLTITKVGGGNLGSSIKSIALYSGGKAPQGSRQLRVDAFIACTTTGLNLQSLISNDTILGSTEEYYPIKSIVGTTITLDGDTSAKSNETWSGYKGDTENIPTYFCEGFKTSLATLFSTQVNTLYGYSIIGMFEYSGGWEIGTIKQNGRTIFDGLNGYGHGLIMTSTLHIKINTFELVRYYTGVYNAYIPYLIMTNLIVIGNSNGISAVGFSINSSPAYKNYIMSCIVLNNLRGIYSTLSFDCFILFCEIGYSQSVGISLLSCFNNSIIHSTIFKNQTVGIYLNLSCLCYIMFCSTSENLNGGVYSDIGHNYLQNTEISETTEIVVSSYPHNEWVWSLNHDNYAGNHRGILPGAIANIQESVVHDTEPVAWKITITDSYRSLYAPVKLKIAEIPFEADTEVIVTAWVKKEISYRGECFLLIEKNENLGILKTYDIKAWDDDWEQLSVSFTPTKAGVTDVYFASYYSNGTSIFYIGTITVQQQ